MAMTIVEELWTRIRAAIDDKIVAAEDAAASAEADRAAIEGNVPIIVSSLPASPLPGRIYLVTG